MLHEVTQTLCCGFSIKIAISIPLASAWIVRPRSWWSPSGVVSRMVKSCPGLVCIGFTLATFSPKQRQLAWKFQIGSQSGSSDQDFVSKNSVCGLFVILKLKILEKLEMSNSERKLLPVSTLLLWRKLRAGIKKWPAPLGCCIPFSTRDTSL